MGSAFEEHYFARKARFAVGSSSPEHSVQLSPFSISKFETTIAQWIDIQKWGGKNGYSDLPDGNLGKSSSESLTHPVVGVNWFDAVKWCNAASEKAGLKPCYTLTGKVFKTSLPTKKEQIVCNWNVNGYRLPTEAEWEYASQAGSEGCFYWGDNAGFKYAWRGGRGSSNSNGVTHPVGQKHGNRFGLYDTVGNVWDWCWDWKAPHNMNLTPSKDPKGPNTKKEINDYLEKFKVKRLPKELTEEKKYLGLIKKYQGGRILKGCAYDTSLGYFNFQSSSFRVGLKPEKSDDAVGFRVVRGK